MKPQTPPQVPTDDLFRHRLENLIDTRHELVKLSGLIGSTGTTLMFNGEKHFARLAGQVSRRD